MEDQTPKTISIQEARNLPRAERRRLGRANGIRIPGIDDAELIRREKERQKKK